jgi:hypothetical protein
LIWLLTNFENKKLKENGANAGNQCLIRIRWLKPTVILKRRRKQKSKYKWRIFFAVGFNRRIRETD